MLQLSDKFVPFSLGRVRVDRPLIQAPLDGISDSPYRRITRELGSPLSITEFINALDVVHKAPGLAARIAFDPAERPIVFQLFDEDPQRIIDAAAILEERCRPDLFDVNMGCSVRRVANRGAGAGLLCHPDKVERIVDGLVKRVQVPVTVKIRLGWDMQSQNYLTIGKIAQDHGAVMITLHARTRQQQFSGQSDLRAIAALKQELQIPVVGNGDVTTMAEARQMLQETGCDAVMVGRAAIYNPWIFAGFNLDEVPPELFRETCLKQLQYMMSFHGDKRGCMIYRKFARRALLHIGADEVAIHDLLTTDDPERFSRDFSSLISGGRGDSK